MKMDTRQENLNRIKKIFENNSVYSIKQKINESECLNDANKHLLDIVSDVIASDDHIRIDALGDKQLEILADTINGMSNIYYFRTAQEMISYFLIVMNNYDFCMIDFTKVADRHVDYLNSLLVDFTEAYGNNLTKQWLEEHPMAYLEIMVMIKDYLISEEIYDDCYMTDIEMGMFKRSICNEALIFEGNTLEDKIARIEQMDDNSLLLLYGAATGEFLTYASNSLKSWLINDLKNNPTGKISNVLSPVSDEDLLKLSSQASQVSPADYDEFWKSLEQKYGTTFESYRKFFKNVLNVNEARSLMSKGNILSVVKGVNENLYLVMGKNNEYVRLIK